MFCVSCFLVETEEEITFPPNLIWKNRERKQRKAKEAINYSMHGEAVVPESPERLSSLEMHRQFGEGPELPQNVH